MTRPSDRRGAALLVVLGLLIVLGLITAEVARAARVETGIVTSLRARTVGRYAAESGVVAAVARIEALLDSVRPAAERAALFAKLDEHLGPVAEVRMGDARFGVAVVDLNARIDLNRSDAATVRGLLEQFTSGGRAETIVTAIKSEPLRRLGELMAIPGVDDALALAIAPYVTLSSDGTVNVNSAPEPVLASLPGLGAAMARSIVRRRELGEVLTSTASLRQRRPMGRSVDETEQDDAAGAVVFSPVTPPLLVSTTPSRLLIVSRGWQDGHPLTHEVQAVYALVSGRLQLVSWQERDL